MLGYDTLLGSHYDKYEVLYTYFDIGVPTEEIFKIPEGNVIHALYCRGNMGVELKSSYVAEFILERMYSIIP